MNNDPRLTLEEQLEEILADTERRLQELQEQRQREEIERPRIRTIGSAVLVAPYMDAP